MNRLLFALFFLFLASCGSEIPPPTECPDGDQVIYAHDHNGPSQPECHE